MRFLAVLFFCFFSSFSYSQEKLVKTIELDSIKVSEAFRVVEKEYRVKISYADKIIQKKRISLPSKQRSLQEILDEISKITSLNFEFINQKYIVVSQKKADLFLEKTNHLSEILIKSYLAKGINKDKNAVFTINPKELEILPGLIEADVLESLQELPGVISPNETATGLYVRGGTPDQNQILWDGITIYHTGHFFGMVSNFNPNITNNIVFLNKGIHPKYGERIASVINISTNDSVAKKLSAGFGLNGLSADAFLETPIIKDKLSILVSFRKSYHDIYESNTFEKIEDKVFQSTEIHSSENSEEIFYFKDQTIKLNFSPNNNNDFSLSYIHIDNDLEHFNENELNDENYQDILDTENNGISAVWKKKWSPNFAQTTSFSHSDYSLNYNFLTFKNDEINSNFDKRNYVKNNSFASEIHWNTNLKNSLLFGFQFSDKEVSYSFIETQNNIKYTLDEQKNSLHSFAVYSNFINRTFSLFDFNIGFRGNYFKQMDQFRVEPRVNILANIYNNLKFQFTADVRNQTVSQIDETLISNLSLENKLWRLADGTTAPIINSKQITFGFLYDYNGWSFDIDTYFKKNNGISALKLGFLNSNPNHYTIGEQKISGLDFYIKKDFKQVKTWISYSFTDVKNKFNSINNNQYFTANNQIQHALSSSIAYKTRKIQFALGWKWHSGQPYTKANSTNNLNSPSETTINSERLPNYNRFDFSSIYHFTISKNHKLKGKIGFSIRNLLDNQIVISKEYLGNNLPNEPISLVEKNSIRRTSNFVFRVEL